MSILDRHPAPWTEGCKRDFFDANGECFEMDKEDVAKLAAELAAARAENERLREALQDMLHFFRGNYCDPSKVIEQAEAALRKAGVE